VDALWDEDRWGAGGIGDWAALTVAMVRSRLKDYDDDKAC